MSDINYLVGMSFEESALGALGTAASGVGGLYTGGGIVGHFQSRKAESAEKAIRRLRGDKDADYSGDRTGRHILAGIGGSIPVVGAVTNSMMRSHHHNLRKELSELKKSKGVK